MLDFPTVGIWVSSTESHRKGIIGKPADIFADIFFFLLFLDPVFPNLFIQN